MTNYPRKNGSSPRLVSNLNPSILKVENRIEHSKKYSLQYHFSIEIRLFPLSFRHIQKINFPHFKTKVKCVTITRLSDLIKIDATEETMILNAIYSIKLVINICRTLWKVKRQGNSEFWISWGWIQQVFMIDLPHWFFVTFCWYKS